MQGINGQVDGLDADEGNDDAAQTVDEEVAPQQRGRAHRPVGHALERQRDERDDDERIEDHRGQDGAGRGGEPRGRRERRRPRESTPSPTRARFASALPPRKQNGRCGVSGGYRQRAPPAHRNRRRP